MGIFIIKNNMVLPGQKIYCHFMANQSHKMTINLTICLAQKHNQLICP